MTFDHIISTAVAMACHACGKYASNGMHQGPDGYWRHPECCAVCKPAEPLEPGQAKAAGEQGGLFE
jgi:hypothetical protein